MRRTRSTQWFNTACFVRRPLATTGTRPGNAGRNTVRGPGFARTDLSLFKNIDFRASQRIQLRVEAFNLFNQTRFGQPGIQIGTATFGRITTADDGRIMQLAIEVQLLARGTLAPWHLGTLAPWHLAPWHLGTASTLAHLAPWHPAPWHPGTLALWHLSILSHTGEMKRVLWSASVSVLAAVLTSVVLAQPQAPAATGNSTPGKGLTAVEGIRSGTSPCRSGRRGARSILVEGDGAVGGVSQRGGAPGTRETNLLDPLNMVDKVNAIVLSGGSAYGLDAAQGVMRFLEEHNIGYKVGGGVVPIVPAAILFDLGFGGDWKIRPTADCGYKAATAASNGPVAEGNVGAGAGATVGKMGGLVERRAQRLCDAADESRPRLRVDHAAERPRRRGDRRRQRRRRHSRSGLGPGRGGCTEPRWDARRRAEASSQR